MKRNLFLIASAIILLLAFNSCKSELDLDKTLKFSKLTVEEQKATIEENGIAFVDKMEGLQETTGFTTITQLMGMANVSPDFVAPYKTLQANLVKNDVKSLETFDRQMRVAMAEDEMWGEWTWNFSKDNFDYKAVTTKTAIYKFPATETSKTNNAILTLTLVESNVVAPDTDPAEYMLQKLRLHLKWTTQL
jgi:hypothetical protein